jgi:hypothetical protein
MKLRFLSVVIIVLTASLAFGQKDLKKYVTPTKEDVGVFKNEVRELYEKPSSTVGTNDRLLILETGKQSY